MKSAEEVKAQIEKINSRDLRGAISDAVLHTLLWVLDEKDCPACIRYKICTSEYREESGYCDSYKSKENVMSEKIQMTEEQFREIALYINVNGMNDINHGLSKADIDSSIHDLKQAGYIKKSELQQKVEEVEEIWNGLKHYDYIGGQANPTKIIHKFYEAIQELKKDHPEFKHE